MNKSKVGILVFISEDTTGKAREATDRFYEEIKLSGFGVDIFYSYLFSVYFEKNKLEIFYNQKKINLSKYKFFISRYTNSEYPRIAVARFIEAQGYKVFNSPQAAFLTKNKRESLLKLSQAGLPITPTGINFSQYFLGPHLKRNKNNPIVIKRNYGSLGSNVSIFHSHISFISFMEFISSILKPSEILIQPYIEARAEDYRILVVGNKVVAGMKRKAQGIEFRANLAKGGSGEKINMTKKMADMAIKAAQVLGLDFAGVDLIKDKNGKLMLVEVNSNPGLEIENITGVNVVKEIVKHCVKKSDT